MQPNSNVYLIDKDGSRSGPYSGILTGTFFHTEEVKIQAEEGKLLARLLPSGKEETYLITDATYYDHTVGFAPHWQIKLRRTTAIPTSDKSASHTFNISHSQGFQIGDHNMMQIHAAIQTLVKEIDASPAPAEQKAEARSRLKSFLEHPLVASIAGGLLAAL